MKASSILVNYVLQFGTGPCVFKSWVWKFHKLLGHQMKDEMVITGGTDGY